MCGICGFFGSAPVLDAPLLQRMNDMLWRRGPDDSGYFLADGVGLAMRRLSIIDLQTGKQPIHNEDQTVFVVLNGEIYNYRQLRTRLEQAGHRFYTHSDTEVIVHLYEQYGLQFVDHLRGMFAIALWDANRRRGLVVRDRLGIKPLVYSVLDGAVLFASEIKALRSTGLVAPQIDPQAIDAFFTFMYIPAPYTIYSAIRKLRPGHMLVVENGSVSERQFWEFDISRQHRDAKTPDWERTVEAALRDAVDSHMVSDVPVGAFLSGGIDSGLVVRLMSQSQQDPIRAMTVGFEGRDQSLIDERPIAAEVVSRCGATLESFEVSPDFRGIVGEIVEAFDEPFADDSVVPSYYISQLAAKSLKVVLSGLGGDELFGGYERYLGMHLSEYYRSLVPGACQRLLVGPLLSLIPETRRTSRMLNHMKRFSAASHLPPAERYLGFVSALSLDERRRLFSPAMHDQIDFQQTDEYILAPFRASDGATLVERAMVTDIKTYLPDDILALSDRLSMWHSLEVRVPLVDHQLVELCGRMPAPYKVSMLEKKRLLRRLASRLLPHSVVAHRKQGFESPMGGWIRHELREYAEDILSPARVDQSGCFDPGFVRQKLDDHLRHRNDESKFLFSMIMFQEWFERKGEASKSAAEGRAAEGRAAEGQTC